MKMHNTWIASLPGGDIGKCFTDVNNGKRLTDIDSGRCPTKPHKNAKQKKALHLPVRRCSWFFFRLSIFFLFCFVAEVHSTVFTCVSFLVCSFSMFSSKIFFCCLITSLSLSFEYNLMTVKWLYLGHRYRLYIMVVIHPWGSGTDAILPRCRVVGCGD